VRGDPHNYCVVLLASGRDHDVQIRINFKIYSSIIIIVVFFYVIFLSIFIVVETLIVEYYIVMILSTASIGKDKNSQLAERKEAVIRRNR